MPTHQRVPVGRRDRLVLNFHGLGRVPNTVDAAERPFWCETDQFVSALDSIFALTQSTDLRIEITFDDGNASHTEVALPLLRDRDLTATFFVCAGRIGEDGYLDAAAIRELAAAGMGIGSHGWSHVDWRAADDETLVREIDGAREVLAETLAAPVDKVAIPFGSYDRRVLSHLKRSGFRNAFTSDGGRASRSGWMIPRESYTTAWTADTIPDLVHREPPLSERLRRTVVCTAKRLR
jgi:peptidoglycan/xylan/chitin deacetylase (PgdA/CDA1 family)